MRKLTILFALLTLSVGLAQAECVFIYEAESKLEEEFKKVTDAQPVFHGFDNGSYMVIYEDDVTSIGHNAFLNCTALQSISLPASVTTIAFGAFHNCTTLQSVDLSHVTTIELGAFNNCTALQSITLSANLTTIESGAFESCYALQSISLPASVTTIGTGAFSGCNSLTEVTVPWTKTDKILTIDASVFNDIANKQGPSGATLHVPDGTKAIYEVKEVWRTFEIVDLAALKADTIAAIESAATDAKAAIDAASTYEAANATKTTYKAKIDDAVKIITKAINDEAVATAAIVKELRDKTMLLINGDKEKALIEIAKINAFEEYKAAAIAAIQAAGEGIQNENLNKWINGAVSDIQKSTTVEEVNRIKGQMLDIIQLYKDSKAEGDAAGYARGKAEAKVELLGSMGDECTDCAVVEVTKGDKTITLYAPDSVDYEMKK